MVTSIVPPKSLAVSEQQVIDYLRSHPEFFVNNEILLEELKLPHPGSGNAVSLVARQVQVFREQRDEIKGEFQRLLDIARHNESLFEKSRRLLLNLLEADSIEDILIRVDESIRGDFGVDHCSLLLFGDKIIYPDTNIKMISLRQARKRLGALIDNQRAICGSLSGDRLACLFPDIESPVSSVIKSVAVIPLHHHEPLGMLSLGSHDLSYFDSSMGSLFLSYISDSLSRILPPLLVREKNKG